MSDELARLTRWYSSQCDGDWEQEWGVRIETLDNPGWLLKVNLIGTPLSEAPFTPIRVDRYPGNWVQCYVRKAGRIQGDASTPTFFGAGGSENLSELIRIFCDWAEKTDG